MEKEALRIVAFYPHWGLVVIMNAI